MADSCPAPAPRQEESRFRRIAREYFESPLATIALVVFCIILLAALFAPWISPQNPYDPLEINFMDARRAPGSHASESDMTYWLGTDAQGRDMVSSILYGIRISLAVGVLSSFIAMLVGAALGLVSSYLGGFFDALLMRIVEIQISLPSALVALVFIALFGRGVDRLIIALVLVQWAYFARTVRASALSERNKEYVEAAACLAMPTWRVIFQYIFPNCLAPLLVIVTIQMSHAITLEASLSFLGLGLPVTEPSLGLLISNGFRHLMNGRYWISMYPGLALFVLVMAINLVADRLRDIFNPRLQR